MFLKPGQQDSLIRIELLTKKAEPEYPRIFITKNDIIEPLTLISNAKIFLAIII